MQKMEASMTNREKLQRLLEQADITQLQASILIAEETKRPCSVRTVRSWLADASLSSARPCPDWAIEVLSSLLSAEKKTIAQQP